MIDSDPGFDTALVGPLPGVELAALDPGHGLPGGVVEAGQSYRPDSPLAQIGPGSNAGFRKAVDGVGPFGRSGGTFAACCKE